MSLLVILLILLSWFSGAEDSTRAARAWVADSQD